MTEKTIMSLQTDRDAMARYLWWLGFWAHLGLLFATFGLWVLVFLPWVLGAGQWYSRKRAASFEADLTNKRIKIADGVFFRKVKSIPLDRVTDVVQSQGILERRFGIWRLLVQTAGLGQAGFAEGTVLAVREPERLQEAVVRARNEYVEGLREGPHAATIPA